MEIMITYEILYFALLISIYRLQIHSPRSTAAGQGQICDKKHCTIEKKRQLSHITHKAHI